MKRLVMTLALTTVFSISGLAGDMHGTDFHAPGSGATPQGSSTSPTASVLGDIHTGDGSQPVFEDSLSALLSVLGLVL